MRLKKRIRARLERIPGAVTLARLTVETVRVCLRYRVTGLASEAGFFALLSLPPLVFGLFGGVGYVGRWLGPQTVSEVSEAIRDFAGQFLTDSSVRDVIVPTVDDVLRNGRSDVLSIGLLVSVWSGSRALNVFVDTISIMYGQSGVRGIVRTRALSLSLYLISVLVGAIVIPLVLIGPSLLADMLPPRVGLLSLLYWPVVVIMTTASLTTLFHISTPRRSPWLRDVPGAVLTLVIWLLTSFFLRIYLGASIGGSSRSIYGPLAAPIVVLIWLYFLAIAVLIGAALNAAARKLWPVEERLSSRARLVEWARGEAARRQDQQDPATGARPMGRRRQVGRRRPSGRPAGHERPLTPLPEPPANTADVDLGRPEVAAPSRREEETTGRRTGEATGRRTGEATGRRTGEATGRGTGEATGRGTGEATGERTDGAARVADEPARSTADGGRLDSGSPNRLMSVRTHSG